MTAAAARAEAATAPAPSLQVRHPLHPRMARRVQPLRHCRCSLVPTGCGGGGSPPRWQLHTAGEATAPRPLRRSSACPPPRVDRFVAQEAGQRAVRSPRVAGACTTRLVAWATKATTPPCCTALHPHRRTTKRDRRLLSVAVLTGRPTTAASPCCPSLSSARCCGGLPAAREAQRTARRSSPAPPHPPTAPRAAHGAAREPPVRQVHRSRMRARLVCDRSPLQLAAGAVRPSRHPRRRRRVALAQRVGWWTHGVPVVRVQGSIVAAAGAEATPRPRPHQPRQAPPHRRLLQAALWAAVRVQPAR